MPSQLVRLLEVRNLGDRPAPELGRIERDLMFARALRAWGPSIQRCDELAEPGDETAIPAYSHQILLRMAPDKTRIAPITK